MWRVRVRLIREIILEDRRATASSNVEHEGLLHAFGPCCSALGSAC